MQTVKRLAVRMPIELKQFVARHLGISRNRAKVLIDRRRVLVNGRRVWIATHRLVRGDVVELTGDRAPLPDRLPLLYEDAQVIAVNKPAALVSDQAPGSVEARLRDQLHCPGLRAIHRLDRDTTGVLLLARNAAAFEHYKSLWSRGQVRKIYLAIGHGTARFEKTIVRFPVEGRPAASEITVLRSCRGYTCFRVETRTGRKHQVRQHLAYIHHPIVGDAHYGPKTVTDPLIKSVGRQLLHCWRILLPAPTAEVAQSGVTADRKAIPPSALKKLVLTAPLPADFRRLAHRLGLI